MLGFHVGDHAAAGVDGFAVEQHLRPHDQVAIQQAANAHQHDGAVGGDVTNLVGSAGFGGDHPTVLERRACRCSSASRQLARLQLHLPAAAHQQRANAFGRGLRRFTQICRRLVPKRLQTLFADVFFVGFQIHNDLRRVARDTQGRAGDEKREDQQKPPGAVDRIQTGVAKHLGPKRPELVDVIGRRLVLLEHGADHRGDADDRQQRNREPHRRQQLHRSTHGARRRFDLNAFGGNRHKLKGEPSRKNGPPCLGCFDAAWFPHLRLFTAARQCSRPRP